MTTHPSALSDHLGYLLRQLSNHVSASFAERLARHDISVAQWVVLRVLFDHESLPLKEIVSRVGVDQGSLSRMIDRLIACDLVTRREDKADRRAVAIALTKKARQLVPNLAREADENDQAFFAPLTERQRADFRSTMELLLSRHATATRGIPLQ